ncbi:MAG: GNAT family N-acetyltransferase, partial [Betaproteobacteria bacterium]|nr:GNAT family N-acetyltransferase [Betaproteobacteria bacterium]
AAWDGVEQITLSVTASNHAAVGLYQSVGFVEVGRMPRALRVDGVYYDELNMVRMINPA